MKYLVMIYHNTNAWNALSQADREAIWSEGANLWQELTASGEMVFGEPLATPGQSSVVSVPNGTPLVTDGPFAESKEQFVGFMVIDVASEDRIIELAGRWPDARVGSLEVHAIDVNNAA